MFTAMTASTTSTPAKRWSIADLFEHPGVCLACLLIFSAFFFFYGINMGDLWRTEGLRAIIAQEFLHSGNWIVPRLYGEPLFTKPPGMYAAIALCSWPFGAVTEWTARLPSALAATATMLLFYWYVGRQLGRRAGLLAAVMLPMSPMWLEKASAAEIDMLQVFWTSAAILFFLRALEEKAGWRWWILAGLCMAGGVLTKWTTPAFFYLTAVSLLWWRGELRLLWCRRHFACVAVTAAVCLSWAVAAVALEGWAVFAGTIEREAMQRLSPGHSPEPYPWGETLLHPLKLLVVTLPFSVLALLSLRPSFFRIWDDKGKRLLIALHCWVWPSMLFWSLPTEHTPRHSFPLFPGIAGLAAMVSWAWLTGRLAWRLPRIRPGHVLAGMLVLWLALKLAYVHVVMPRHTVAGQAQVKGRLLASLVPLDEVLYLFRIKDEGIMFYYGRDVIRLASPARLPLATGPAYCIVLPAELQQWSRTQQVTVVRHLTDAQGDVMVLVRVAKSEF